MSLQLDSSVQFLKGVGNARAAKYQKLGINSVYDLLYHFPRRYIDLSSPFTVNSAPFGELVPIKAVLTSKSGEQRIRKGLSIFKLLAHDQTGELEITIFNAQFLVAGLKLDCEYIFYGRAEGSFLKQKMSSPEIYPANLPDSILPVYNQTAGITSGLIRGNIRQLLAELPPLVDSVPSSYRKQYSLLGINEALENIHFPKTMDSAQLAKNRFIFEELLTLSFLLHSLKNQRAKIEITPFENISLDDFYNNLPFKPTSAQVRCISEAVADMMSGAVMNRLIQGDVGSGKTLVAAACIYFTAKNHFQSALMVPTEILAEQHYQTLSELLAPFGITVALLTGSTKASERKEVLAGLEDGTIALCVGTHALLSEKVVYHKLGLVITDEQHRFGVAQRSALAQKSNHLHVLVMSATPIPRTLSLIIYGDLSLSLLDEMPPGRQSIDTLLIDSSKLTRAMGFIRKNIDSGQQAYIVCPTIEAGETDSNLKSVIEYSQQLSQGVFRNYNVGLLHGKMKSKDKESVMRLFKSGDIQLLVSTTVIEVGVDVPNATIMLIENAERFGLSQLHQLRGRVGRGHKKSYCILVSDSGGEVSVQRLNAMKTLDDGFKLAEYDLKLRGPGDFFGFRQHGLPALKIADLSENSETVSSAQRCAKEIFASDPLLAEHPALKQGVEKMTGLIGERPN